MSAGVNGAGGSIRPLTQAPRDFRLSVLGSNPNSVATGGSPTRCPMIVSVPPPEFATSMNWFRGSIAMPTGARPTGIVASSTSWTAGPGTSESGEPPAITIWNANTTLPSVLVT